MQLYYHPISSFSHKVRMGLEEKAVAYECVPVILTDTEARKVFRARYPLGKVPLLVEGDMRLGESTAIIEWLDIHHPAPRLVPEDAELARQTRYWDRMVDLYLLSNQSMLFFQSLKPLEQQDRERIATAEYQVKTVMDMLEARLASQEGEYVVGDALSLADLGLLVFLDSASLKGALKSYPALSGYFERHQSRPSLRTARATFMEGVAMMKKAFAGG